MKKVLTGIDREEELSRLLSGRRVGLITGSAGVTRDGRFTIDVLRERFHLAALFAPEHGINGVLAPGETVHSGVDPRTGLPVYSLFEDFIYSEDAGQKTRAYQPSSEAMSKIDVMVFDMQDVGSRYFTYASTLFYTMRACGNLGMDMVVLDRPNPIGGTDVEGNCHDPELLSFIGLTRVPIRHGMTIGELARYYNGEYELHCPLHVVKMEGWRRSMYFDETGLPYVKPSPNLPTLDSVVLYNGTCLFSGTNVSEGRGTSTPFSTIGAPYIEPSLLCGELNGLSLPGVFFTPTYFLPEFSKYKGEICGGVHIHVTDKKAVRPVALGVYFMRTVQRLYPEDFRCNPPATGTRYHIDIASGSRELRENLLSAAEILEKWDKDAEAFLTVREKYLIYE